MWLLNLRGKHACASTVSPLCLIQHTKMPPQLEGGKKCGACKNLVCSNSFHGDTQGCSMNLLFFWTPASQHGWWLSQVTRESESSWRGAEEAPLTRLDLKSYLTDTIASRISSQAGRSVFINTTQNEFETTFGGCQFWTVFSWAKACLFFFFCGYFMKD